MKFNTDDLKLGNSQYTESATSDFVQKERFQGQNQWAVEYLHNIPLVEPNYRSANPFTEEVRHVNGMCFKIVMILYIVYSIILYICIFHNTHKIYIFMLQVMSDSIILIYGNPISKTLY